MFWRIGHELQTLRKTALEYFYRPSGGVRVRSVMNYIPERPRFWWETLIEGAAFAVLMIAFIPFALVGAPVLKIKDWVDNRRMGRWE